MDNAHDTVRLGLRINAGFSLLTGLLLAAVPGVVGDWLGVSIDGWLRLLGIALLGHVVVLLVISGVVSRPLGVGLVLVDAAVVGGIAMLHVVGLRGTQADETVPQAAPLPSA